MKIAREGLPFVFGLGILTLAAGLLGWSGLGLALLVATLAVAGFFRDPERDVPEGDDLVVSPADGRIVAVTEPAELESRPGVPYRRVSIFMSPLNVHVNRLPTDGEIVGVEHTPGRFGAAYAEAASTTNERNEVVLRDPRGRILPFVQIAGWLARRIVCHVKPGDTAVRGERFGLIMFGSRVDVFLPAEAIVDVQVGERVRAGSDVIARFGGAT